MADGSNRNVDQPSTPRESSRPISRKSFLAGGAALLAAFGLRSATANASPESPGGPPLSEDPGQQSTQETGDPAKPAGDEIISSPPIDSQIKTVDAAKP